MNLADYHSNLPFSFSGKNIVYASYPHVPKSEIDKTLEESDIYSRYKPFRKSYTSPVYVHKKRELFQADLGFMTLEHQVESNNGMKYLLVIIDCFTKKIWMYPLPDKKCLTVYEKFQHLLETIDQKPERLQTDRGAEFLCANLAKLFEDNQVHHYITNSDKKASVVERSLQTLKNWLYKMMDEANTHNWVDLLPQLEQKYLSTHHSTIKMSPNQAELDENQEKLRLRYHQLWGRHKPQKKPKFKIGDKVRIAGWRRSFRRSFYGPYSHEYFTVYKIKPPTTLPKFRYYLKDVNNNLLKEDPSWWDYELSRFRPTKDSRYKIDKILRTRNNGKQSEVTWVGWPASHTTWIDTDQMESVS